MALTDTKRYDGPTISQAARKLINPRDFMKCHCGARHKLNRERPWTVYATTTDSGPHIVLEVHTICTGGHRGTTSCFLDLESWR